MDKIKALVQEFEDARANNRAEWETFSEEIKGKINGFNEMIAAHKIKEGELEEKAKGMSKKQEEYKKKHMEFEV